MRALLATLTRVRVLNLRELRSHRLRVFTTLSVVTVAAALLVAVFGTYGSFTESVRQFNAAISGVAQVEVAAIADTGLDAQIAGEIRREVPDARSVVPMIRDAVLIDGRTMTLLGSDLRAQSLAGDALGDGLDLSGIAPGDLADGVIVSAGTGLEQGQRVVVNGVEVRVLRVVDGGDELGGQVVFAYLDLAQQLSGRDGRLDSVLIVAEPQADISVLREQVDAVVAGRAVVVDPDFRTQQTETAGAITRDSTLLVSLISLVIAGFLVFNTMNMAVASRRQSLAMIRALGAKRRHLVADLLGEATVLGLIGGLVGVPVGVLAGRWAIERIPEQPASATSFGVEYHLPGFAPVVAVAACILACVAATSLAARSVFAVSPVEAMVSGAAADAAPTRGPAVWLALAFGLAGIAGSVIAVATIPGRPAILGAAAYAVGALLLCFAATGVLVRLVVRVARWMAGPGRLASVNAERSPRRAWATLMTVAVAIAVGMGTSGALDNLVSSVSDSLEGLGDPDFYVSSTPVDVVPTGPLLEPEVATEIAAIAGVARVVGMQWAGVNLAESRVLIQGLAPGASAPFTERADPDALRQVIDGDGIILSTVLARHLALEVGDSMEVATPTGPRSAVVRDVVDYVALQSGTAAMSNEVVAQWFDRPGNTFLQVDIEPGADRATIRAELAAVAARHPSLGDRPVQVYTGEQALAATEQSAQQAGEFAVGIQWIVALAAAIALLNTLLLSVIERRRELGVLRAMGASRRFISRMVLAEAAAVAAVGSLVGLVMGTGLHYLADQVLTATTAIDVAYEPRPSTLLFVGVAVGLCLLGALVPASRASRQNISEAILAD